MHSFTVKYISPQTDQTNVIMAYVQSPVTCNYNSGGMNPQVSLNYFIASLKVACIFYLKQIFTKITEAHQLRNYYSLYCCNMTY